MLACTGSISGPGPAGKLNLSLADMTRFAIYMVAQGIGTETRLASGTMALLREDGTAGGTP